MANILMNLCLDARTSGVEVTFEPRDNADPPAPEEPWYYRVYWSQSDTPDAIEGNDVTLEQDGDCRIVVWDAYPDQAPASIFEQPTFVSPALEVTLTGEFRITSAGARDPWPPS